MTWPSESLGTNALPVLAIPMKKLFYANYWDIKNITDKKSQTKTKRKSTMKVLDNQSVHHVLSGGHGVSEDLDQVPSSRSQVLGHRIGPQNLGQLVVLGAVLLEHQVFLFGSDDLVSGDQDVLGDVHH